MYMSRILQIRFSEILFQQKTQLNTCFKASAEPLKHLTMLFIHKDNSKCSTDKFEKLG